MTTEDHKVEPSRHIIQSARRAAEWLIEEGRRLEREGQEKLREAIAAERHAAERQTSSSSDERVYYYSERGFPLVYYGKPEDVPVLTVENYCKWYKLYLVQPTGEVTAIPFPDEGYTQPDESAYADHAPNPEVVERFAEAKGYYLDSQSHEMIIGRWILDGPE